MKERNLYNEEFERQLKEKADQFKMYPSDKVWNEVHSSLHTRKRRFVLGMSFLIGSILFLAGTQLISPVHNTHANSSSAKMNTAAKQAASTDLPDFTPGNFEAAPLNNSADHSNSAENQSGTTSFILRPAIAPEKSGPEMQESVIEKNTIRIKPIQPVEQTVSGKSETPVSTADLMESMNSVVNNPAPDIIAAEMISEKRYSAFA